ncbi:MAG: NAD(P)/FAD-dependent oxidoreductase [Thermodesulfobacteriota bacterium]|nr:NAD(P)/FAD-dependent oxidoreductase [Thermodesulfobacteriota bacterium]
MTTFKHLLEPITIKSMTLPNRMVMPALTVNTAMGEINDATVAYYERRARGGAALVTVGISPVVPGMVIGLDISDDRFIEGHRRVVEAVHQYETKVNIQLWHPGRYEMTFLTGRQAVSASDVAPPIFAKEKPRPLTVGEIGEIVAAFGEAARRSKDAGYDCVEIIASAGYLISQFMSPVTNLRTDEYGGSLENRARFGTEVIQAVRGKVGADFPIFVRMVGDELIPGGNTIEEMKRFAKIWEDAGADAFNVTAGWHESREPMITMNVERAGFVWMAEGIKSALDHAPVAASNRINDPEIAEQVLAEGRADMVSLARAMVCDPDFADKVKQGRPDLIRRCIACMNCMDSLFEGKPVTCSLNAEACRESQLGDIQPADEKKKVLVIGGGVAGCEAARVAALRGHTVVLFEADTKLGGQLNLASKTPDFGEFSLAIDYFSAILKELGVDVRLGQPADEALVKAENPDAIIYAAGATPADPQIKGIDGENVMHAWQVLSGEAVPGKRVAVIGGGGTGCDVCMHLAHDGKEVTQVEMLEKMGHNIGPGTKWVVLKCIQECGVEQMNRFQVKEITEKGVVGEIDGEATLVPADTVVVAIGSRPNTDLLDKLSGYNVIPVGDAKQPRKIMTAVHEGYAVAREI